MKIAFMAGMFALAMAGSTGADAAITINITQVGGDVVAAGTGSFDTSELSKFVTDEEASSVIQPRFGYLLVGNRGIPEVYIPVTGPSSFGNGSFDQSASSATGDIFGIYGEGSYLYLPSNYQSGSALNGTATFRDSTFGSLGITAGTYTYRSPSDTLTLNIGNVITAVPEPATWALMIGGFGMIGGTMRRKRKASVAFSRA